MTEGDLAAVLDGWDPPVVEEDDPLAAGTAAALGGLLDWRAPVRADELAPLWHWGAFLSWPPGAALGADGHPADGALLPPIPDRTRMFAGGRLAVHGVLRTGRPAQRRTEVVDRQVKRGRSGELAFVTVRAEVSQAGTVVVVEEQDLVYRRGARAPAPPTATATPDPAAVAAAVGDDPWRRDLTVDPVTLFRFSALTANAHRIHYDEPYATGEEGYPGLVVHGPLLAMVMVDLARWGAAPAAVATATYRFVRPLFAGERAVVVGRLVDGAASLRVVGPDGTVRAQATVAFAGDGAAGDDQSR